MPGERPVGAVEAADVVPEAGEGEPDDVGAVLEDHVAVDAHGRIEGHGLGQRHLHVVAVQHQSLVEDLDLLRRTQVVDPDAPFGAHSRPLVGPGSTASTKTSMVPPHTAGLQERKSSVRSTVDALGLPGLQHPPRRLDDLGFAAPSAHGAGEPALGVHQQARADLPGRGAAGGHHGGQGAGRPRSRASRRASVSTRSSWWVIFLRVSVSSAALPSPKKRSATRSRSRSDAPEPPRCTFTSSAATATAISSGVSAPMSRPDRARGSRPAARGGSRPRGAARRWPAPACGSRSYRCRRAPGPPAARARGSRSRTCGRGSPAGRGCCAWMGTSREGVGEVRPDDPVCVGEALPRGEVRPVVQDP